MKKVFFPLLLLVAFQVSAQPAKEWQPLLDSLIDIMRNNALHRHELNWRKVRGDLYDKTKGIQELDSLLARMPYLFELIGDYHGGIQTNSKFYSWTAGQPPTRSNTALDSAMRKAPKLLTQRWGDIGYFRLPGGTTKNLPLVTQMLSDSLCTLQPATIKGWIIDLRLNTGGNIWFMLPPLAGLLGEGMTGGVKYVNGQPDGESYIKDGKVWGNGTSYEVPQPKCIIAGTSIPVVILTGSKTASSAEGITLAFKGRPNTIVIGEPTAGLITSNNTWTLRHGITLVLATGYMMDRQGNHYTTAITPDLLIEGGDDLFQMEHDSKITAAKEWLDKILVTVR